jgi:adenine/guanine/hypoxanthine permease
MPMLFVNGTLMRGLSLHGNLAGARFLAELRTAPAYRLHSIGDVHPGMVRDDERGASLAGELYELPDDVLARVESGEPPGLYVGEVELEDGRVVPGVLYRADLTAAHPDITRFGGWRAYLAARDEVARDEVARDEVARDEVARDAGAAG